jgi:hypothetical protein
MFAARKGGRFWDLEGRTYLPALQNMTALVFAQVCYNLSPLNDMSNQVNVKIFCRNSF